MTDISNHTFKAKKFGLVAIGLLGFIMSNFSTFIFLKTHPAMAILEGVLRVSGNILLAATIAISIVELLRPKEEAKPRKKRVVAAIGLMLVAIGLSLMSFKASSEFKKFGEYVQGTDVKTKEKIIKKLNSSEPVEKKSKLSRLYAQITYEDEGKIIEYLRADGKSEAYVPSPEAINNRDMVLFFRTYWKLSPLIDSFVGIVWLVSLIAAISFSFRGRKCGSATPNQPV